MNTKTGDVYVGSIINYHLKRKVRKLIRRNYFFGETLSHISSLIRSRLKAFCRIWHHGWTCDIAPFLQIIVNKL